MSHKQIEAIVILDEVIKKFEGCENVYLAMEDAVALKELIENQAKHIKELEENVIEVKHGRWVERSDKGIIGVLRCPYACNICGRVETFKEPYCNCGAKMEGEE